jgi:hypothetical protein
MKPYVCLLALAGYQVADAGKDPPPRPPTSVRFEHDMMVRFHMHENFDLLRAIEKLLVRGKLDEAKALASSIANAPEEPGLEPWTTESALVRQRAEMVAVAPSVDEALRREARLAEACAGCHLNAGVVPEFKGAPAIPPDKPTIEARMARHLWASDRLWEGLIGDADESWRAGLDVLAATPLPFSQVGGDRATLARELQRKADEARTSNATDKLADRARAYGEILVTCAACHAQKK